jgi:tRNA A37 threonylcarbamoyladenosine biosynthesis protein TsaE
MGIRDYFDLQRICFIEWPAQGGALLPPADLVLQFMPTQQGRSLAVLQASPEIKNCIPGLLKQQDTDII